MAFIAPPPLQWHPRTSFCFYAIRAHIRLQHNVNAVIQLYRLNTGNGIQINLMFYNLPERVQFRCYRHA
ncbi:MAG: hypothetical protein DSY83_00685, partial [Flavobacteriia bacterium]